MWHASGCGRTLNESRSIALQVVSGVGDPALGEWQGIQGRSDIWHVQRRLTAEEREAFGVPEPRDIRGTDEELERIAVVLVEAPHLASKLTGL